MRNVWLSKNLISLIQTLFQLDTWKVDRTENNFSNVVMERMQEDPFNCTECAAYDTVMQISITVSTPHNQEGLNKKSKTALLRHLSRIIKGSAWITDKRLIDSCRLVAHTDNEQSDAEWVKRTEMIG